MKKIYFILTVFIWCNAFVFGQDKTKDLPIYISDGEYYKVSVENVYKRRKLNSKITGTYQIDKNNVLQIVELSDNKIFFTLTLCYREGIGLGDLDGLVDIKEKIIFEKKITEYGLCKFEMKILHNKIEIKTIDNCNECGYGHNVCSDGTFLLQSHKCPDLNKYFNY